MSTHLFFSGGDGNTAFPVLNKQRVRFRRMSFYYLRRKSNKRLEELMFQTEPEDVVYFIDSGASKLDSRVGQIFTRDGAEQFLAYVHKYVEDYCQFLQKYSSRIFCASEIDIDPLFREYPQFWEGDNFGAWTKKTAKQKLDWEKEKKWSGKYGFSPAPILDWRSQVLSTGVPTVLCWHPERQWEGWVDQCSKHPNNALVGKELELNDWAKHMLEARSLKTRVHGFAMSKPEWIRRLPLYSIDTSSWLDGSKYGTTVAYQNKRIRYFTREIKEETRKRYRKMYGEWGVDLHALDNDKGTVVDEINLIAWLQYADYLEKKHDHVYWETELNGAPLGSLGPVRGGEMPELEPEDGMGRTKEIQVEAEAVEMAEGTSMALVPQIVEPPSIPQTFSQSLNFSGKDNIKKMADEFLQLQYQRTTKAAKAEEKDGGILDRQVSSDMSRMWDMIKEYHEMFTPNEEPPSMEVKVKGPGPVSQLLQQVFSSPSKEKKPN